MAQSHTPCNRCVRFATTVASGHATLATKRTLLLTWAGLAPAGSHQLVLAHLFDHLVGAAEQSERKGDAERLGGLEVQGCVWHFARICKAAGIQNLRRHDLRHSFASNVISAGFTLSDVGALLGHTTAQTTMRYAHLTNTRLREATEAAGKAVGQSAKRPRVKAG